jgi:hypothetical protein
MEQSCLTKRFQWISPLSDRLRETSLKEAGVEGEVCEEDEAGAEARVAAEVARGHARRARMETSNDQEGRSLRIQFRIGRSCSKCQKCGLGDRHSLGAYTSALAGGVVRNLRVPTLPGQD